MQLQLRIRTPMAMFAPFVDKSVVRCGPMKPLHGAQPWADPVLPLPLPAAASQPLWYPAPQPLGSMAPGFPAGVVLAPTAGPLPDAVYANQLEVELGGRALTLPTRACLDVEALEQQLGVAPKGEDGKAARRRNKKPPPSGPKTDAAGSVTPDAEAEAALEALTAAVEAAFAAKGGAKVWPIPAEELKATVASTPGYALVLRTYAAPGSYKAVKGAIDDLAAFVHVIKTRMDEFFVEMESPFPVRRAEKKKRWVPAPADQADAKGSPSGV